MSPIGSPTFSGAWNRLFEGGSPAHGLLERLRGLPNLELRGIDGARSGEAPRSYSHEMHSKAPHTAFSLAAGNPMETKCPPAERFQSLLRGLEGPHLRTHGELRTLVGFPEKPPAVENDPVGVGRLGANEILTRHRLNRFRTKKRKVSEPARPRDESAPRFASFIPDPGTGIGNLKNFRPTYTGDPTVGLSMHDGE